MYISQIETILVDIQKRAVCVFTGTVRCIETLTKRARRNMRALENRLLCKGRGGGGGGERIIIIVLHAPASVWDACHH